ncbi:MAG: choice-of-anchor B family protein [Flavobacteriales bacterium]|nr:choice-of-anchor B family protein [Flavobacteriales bacterium]
MINKVVLALFALLLSITSFSQLNISQLGYVDVPSLHGGNDLSDVWGYVDGAGEEYAIVGVENGTSICHVTNPATASEVFFEAGMNSIWRDMKVWNNYAFITTEANNGLLIIDLSGLSGGTPVTLSTTYYTGPVGDSWDSAHNLFIDENGVCYIFGANRGNQGVIMLDVTNPSSIVELGIVDDYYVHDGVAKGDTLYCGNINEGFMTIWDVSNKTAPVLLGSSPTPGNFTHNMWFSDDLNYVYTTDEITNGYIGEYNVSDPTNIYETDRIQSSAGMDVIPHNAHFMNDYIITSYYRDGIVIHDVSNKGNMVEVGNFDTSPAFSGDGFNGCWGAYPWLPSGNILATDIENGLFILGTNYQRGCYLEGTVTDISTTGPINGVQIELVTTSVMDNSDIVGNYAAGYHAAGTYDVIYSHPGYLPDTAYGVVLTNGVITVQDIQLTPIVPVNISGNVSEQIGGANVAGAQVIIENVDFTFTTTTDGSGNWNVTGVIPGDYLVTVGDWGYVTTCASFTFDLTNSVANMQLEVGYADDFSLDLGWVETSSAASGIFVRVDPIEISGGSGTTVPDDDLSGDCGDRCYTTGNGASSAGADDVDDGETKITSPVMDLSGYVNPYLNFSRYWNNSGGGFGSTRNDSLTVIINDGTNDYVIDYYVEADNDNAWTALSYRIKDVVALTSTMTITFHTEDESPGHLVEASIDGFLISDSTATDLEDPINGTTLVELIMYPNPSSGLITMSSNGANILSYEVLTIAGQLVEAKSGLNTNTTSYQLPEESGVYLFSIKLANGNLVHRKVIRK